MSLMGRGLARTRVGCSTVIASLQRPRTLFQVPVRQLSSTGKDVVTTRGQRLSKGGAIWEGQLSFDGKKVTVPWQGGTTSQFHNIWLRDHCQCKECLHEETRQRLLDILSIPKDIQAEAVTADDKGLRIIWQNDHHESYFPWSWLRRHSYNPKSRRYWESPKMEFWGGEIGQNPPTVQYQDVMASDQGVAEWTYKIRKFGFCYVDGCPVSPEKTQELLERIAFIRPTHYGGFYDFTADLASKDTAYTSLALHAHTDTTYFSDPAGLQMFHLLSHTDGSGGESLLVDGFAAARILQLEAERSFQVLSSKVIRTHASGNEGISIQPFVPRPVFNYWADRLYQVRWNTSDRATMDRWRDDKLLEEWYEAAWKWSEILRRPSVEYWEQLQPGRPLIFDNWRVLHGRSAFTGKRRICGGYINHDDFMSRYRMTNLGRERVLQDL